MDKNYLKEQIRLATEAIEDITDDTLKEVAFKCVLTNLLSRRVDSFNVDSVGSLVPVKNNPLQASLGLSDDVWQQVFKVEGDVIELNIKVEAASVAEQQRKLAHVLLLGYKVLLNVSEVTGSTILKVAKEWDISTESFPRNVKASEYIQTKNSGKGKDPKYLLKPGSVDKLTAEIKALVSHE